MSIKTRDLAGGVGQEVLDIDLSKELADDVKDAIREALSLHCALLFRGQNLQPQEQIRFTEIFGKPQPHPLKARRTVEGFPEVIILENRPGKRGAANDYWHSDISHSKTPPSLSILHSLKVPEGRGDTMICNMYTAWETLSEGMREMLSKIRAEHSAEATVQRSQIAGQDALPLTDVPPPSMHPVGRTHPQTGRVALFINPEHFTTRFEDMTREESQPLMDFLNRHATKPENVYRHRWAVGDVLMWDNRCTMHYAVRDYDENMPRLMHRTTAAGEVPV